MYNDLKENGRRRDVKKLGKGLSGNTVRGIHIMFGRFRTNYEEQLRLEKERLQTMGEKELLIEMIMELKRIDQKCDDIARKIVIWSN